MEPLWSLFLLKLCFIFVNLLFNVACNTFDISGLVLVIILWIRWASRRSAFVASLETLALPRNVTSVGFMFIMCIMFCFFLENVHLNRQDWHFILIFVDGPLVTLIVSMIFLSPFVDLKKVPLPAVYFFAQLDSESFLISWFHSICGLTCFRFWVKRHFPAGTSMFKVNNRNTTARCGVCSKLTIKTPERRQWRHSDVFIVNSEHISPLALEFLLLILNR